MIFNFTQNLRFNTRLMMDDYTLPIVNKTKLLGTTITNYLKWDDNTAELVKKANSRLLLLRKAAEYTSSKEDLKQIYISYVRSILEQSAVVWHSSLSKENESDLEIVQKNALRIILKEKYVDYNHALLELDLFSLFYRREKILSHKFALNCIENEKTKKHFPLNIKKHNMETRNKEKCIVTNAKTE